jgi:hypothetical protein
LKTVYFKETIVSDYFLGWSSAAAASFSVAMVGATPYKLFLKVPWANKQLASSNFAHRARKKEADEKSSK